MFRPRKRKKARKAPPTSSVCSNGCLHARIVTGTNPRLCAECHIWPPDPNDKLKKKEGKRRERHPKPRR